MSVEMNGPWSAAHKFHVVEAAAMRARHRSVMKSEAEEAARRIRECIETQGVSVGEVWEPLSAWTHYEKGTSNKLRDTDTLLRSIMVRRISSLKYEAGVDPSARYVDGSPVIDIANTLEFGAIVYVEMTARMAKYLAIRAQELGIPPSKAGPTPVGGTMVIRIPKRSFMMSTKNKFFTPLAIGRRVLGKIFKPLGKAFSTMGKGKK